MADLRFENPKTTEAFCALIPEKFPLPWKLGKSAYRGSIMDANGKLVVSSFDKLPEAEKVLTVIILAVNTCGGFRAEVTK